MPFSLSSWPLQEDIDDAGEPATPFPPQWNALTHRLNPLVLAETWFFEGSVAVGTGLIAWPAPFALTVVEVVARAATAPTGASLIADVNKNATTIFGTQANRPTIAAGSTAVATAGAASVTTASKNDLYTVDIDQVGSTVPGSNLVVQLRYLPT